MLLALLASAFAAPLRVPAPVGATAEVLPLVEPGRVEILVRDGDASAVGKPFEGFLPDGVRAGRVTNFGGHFVVTVWMRRSGDTLALDWTGDGWNARPVARGAAVSASVRSGEAADAMCVSVPGVVFVPLHGKDVLEELPPAVTRPVAPRWRVAEPVEVTWERIAVLRDRTFGGTPPKDRSRELYELGALHRDLGHAREAALYFGLAVEAGAPADVVMLQRAGALLSIGDYDGARAAVDAVPAAPATERAAMEAAIALRTGLPAPLAAGRALAASVDRVDTAVLAGALLLRGGCWVEAEAVLAPYASANDPRAPLAALLLADARLLQGNLDGASTALSNIEDANLLGPLRSLARARTRLLATVRQTPAYWAGVIPSLGLAGRDGDTPEALEALWLRGQIAEELGDDDEALAAYGALVDRRRTLLGGEPGARLAAAWQRRVQGLFDAGRDIDALVAHLGAWRPGLSTRLAEPGPLLDVARTWASQGLHDEALDVLTEVAALQGERGLDDRATVLAIAEGYRRSGRTAEAIEALDFLATRAYDAPGYAAQAALLRGRVLADKGNAAAARAAWATLVEPPRRGRGAVALPVDAVSEANLRIALSDAEEGRCEPLLARAEGPIPDDLSAGWIAAVRSRCLSALARPDEARAAARAAAERLIDPDAASWARGLAGEPASGVWKQIAEDAEADAALRERLTTLGGG